MRFLVRLRPLLVPSFLLAVGLGTAATALSLQRALTSSSLPYPAADRLVTLIAGSKSWSGPMLDALEARTTVFDALSMIQERAAVGGVDRRVPAHDVASLEGRLGTSLAAELFLLRILTAFSVAGLLLAAVGTYATAAHAVVRSRRELGVRIALGATSAQIWSLVGRRGVVVGLFGATAGAAGALMSGQLLASMLHGISARDPIALGLAPAVTVSGVLLAVALPAWRASRVSAVEAMRGE